MNFQRAVLILLAAILLPGLAMAQTSTRATFEVIKYFDDENEATVDVHISCNTGLPLEQTKTIEAGKGNGVEFIVTDFDGGQLDCDIWETPVLGYSYDYDDDCSAEGDCDHDDDGCYFTNFYGGDQGICIIDNDLLPVMVDVTKVWFDEHPEFNNDTYARASWGCDNPATIGPGMGGDEADHYCGYDKCGSLHFDGTTDDDYFLMKPDWENGTVCDVNERTYDSGVEADDSDCQNLVLWPGIGAECTIENTRFYEGIPTLNQYGLAIMALLMLGLGFVGFRRFV